MFKSYVDIVLDNPLHYAGIKSKALLLYIFKYIFSKMYIINVHYYYSDVISIVLCVQGVSKS